MKTRKGVQKIYSEVVDTYELVNHILTFGFDIRWRKAAARLASKQNRKKVLDVCTGTGEMAQAVARYLEADARILSTDFSYPMLIRAKSRNHMSGVSFVLAEAGELPFSDKTFDLLTISFATRNLNIRRDILLTYLKEFYRTLDRGGAFINVETSQPSNPLLRKIFFAYVKTFVRPVGSFFSGSKPGYRYLAHTIPRFCSADEFSSLLYSAGFSHVGQKPLLGGIAAIHLALK
jgi:demethylmenaquinone methyltransferase/2-methoxy-6-polyprenyl-1,4-benzoquinol methylase